MPTAAQTADRTASAYLRLVWELADGFEPGDLIRPRDIPTLTDAQLGVILAHQEGEAGFDAARPLEWADILGTDATPAQRDAALVKSLRDAFQHSAREYVYPEVNDELFARSEPVDVDARAADRAGVSQADFA